MEFLNNICAWFQNNWDAVAAVLSTVTTVCFIPLAKIITSQKNDIANNTSSTKELKTTIEETKELKTVVETNTTNNKVLCCKVDAAVNSLGNLKTDYTELKTAFLQVNSKLGSILDVLSIVYSTVKDETIRNSIANIINSVKYNDSAIESEVKVAENNAKQEENAKVAAELQAQINELENKVKETQTSTVKQTIGAENQTVANNSSSSVRY